MYQARGGNLPGFDRLNLTTDNWDFLTTSPGFEPLNTGAMYAYDGADRGKFFDAYFMWLGDFFDNIKGLTLYVIKSHWLPENITIPKDNVSFPPG
jgi:hypothetical protein